MTLIFPLAGLSLNQVPVEIPPFSRLIEDDKTVSDNYQRLLLDSITALYGQNNKKRTAEDICEELVGQIRTSMVNIFGESITQWNKGGHWFDCRCGLILFPKR